MVLSFGRQLVLALAFMCGATVRATAMVVRPPERRATAFTTGTLRTAVTAWCSNAASAEATYGHISDWDTSEVEDMSNLFNKRSGEGCYIPSETFNEDITKWDTSKVTDMEHMFSFASAFNQDISSWDVSSVVNINNMFKGAAAFNQDISSWSVSQVTDMEAMFNGAAAFNQDISSWSVSQVTNMGYMFRGAAAFSHTLCWNDISAADTGAMFSNSGGGSVRGDCAQCGAGEYRVNPDTCTLCPAGSFAPIPLTGTSGAVSCTDCEAGEDSPPGSSECEESAATAATGASEEPAATAATGAICFTGDSTVRLQDGTTKRFHDVEVKRDYLLLSHATRDTNYSSTDPTGLSLPAFFLSRLLASLQCSHAHYGFRPPTFPPSFHRDSPTRSATTSRARTATAPSPTRR